MKLKSYFAGSVQEAIERARQELGPDAMLLNSRKISAEQRHLGAYEVVFGVGTDSQVPRNNPVRNSPTRVTGMSDDLLAQEMAELRKQIESVKKSLSQSEGPKQSEEPERARELEELHTRLRASDFSEQLAGGLLNAIESRVLPAFEPHGAAKKGNFPDLTSASGSLAERAELELIGELERRFEVKPELGKSGVDRRVLMLVGPPGAGKTTTLVKLAVKCGLSTRTSLRIISTDTLRVGGSDQLASYSRIVGAGFEAVQTTTALEQALEESSSKKLVLIDTPGYGAAELDEAAELATFTKRHPEIEVQLVLPAFARLAVLQKMSERFEMFQPAKLLFTHMDEIETPGPILEHTIQTKLPISFLCNGQAIPQDLVEASKERLTEGLSTRSRVIHSAA